MGPNYSRIRCKSAVSKSNLPGLDYTINPYIGCEHGCIYCYVPDIIRRKEFLDSWGELVYAKENFVEVLSKEVGYIKPGVVGYSTVTDPYQPYEKKMCFARKIIETLLQHNFRISFQTKSSLILRDVDIIEGDKVEVGFTITSLDREFARKFEPNSSSPEERVQALETFSEKGVKTWIFYGPIIFGFNDDDETIKNIMSLAKRTRSYLIYDKLRLKPILSKRMMKHLGEEFEKIRGHIIENDFRKVYYKVIKLSREYNVKVEAAFT
ncbi:MAG: radical SAM protein [Nitrososphaeria archaeon]|nr:radical SAM protein [Nitrososphaeria archaeon]